MSATSTGFRKIVSLGNTCFTNNSYRIRNLPPGTYYWGVQAIDNAYKGGAFSTGNSFTIIQPFTEMTGISLTGIYSGSANWGDYDNDNDLDILLTGIDQNNVRYSKIYRNDGSNTFTEMTAANLTPMSYNSNAWDDFDKDGDLDLLSSGWSVLSPYNSKIYRNNGSFSFSELTAVSLPGIFYGSVASADFDNDGDPDILSSGTTSTGKATNIFRNDGSDNFTVLTGLNFRGLQESNVAWGDYDNDGDQDFLATGDTGFVGFSILYRNNANGSFTEMTGISFTGIYHSAVAWGDYDNDNDLDLLISGNTASLSEITKIYRNNGNSTFTDMTGISLLGLRYSTAKWGDYDNDGDLDILLSGYGGPGYSCKIYRNENGANFTDMTGISLTGVYFGSSDWGDYDNDGDLDILLTGFNASGNTISKIYRNNSNISNSPPSAPGSLTDSVAGNNVYLGWGRSTDDFSHQNSLTYNIYIGSTPAAVNNLPPNANTSGGFRKLPGMGNTCLKKNRYEVKNLPGGYHYWGVQAIDNAWQGGNFAVDSFFIKYDQTITFNLPAKTYGDTNFNPGATAGSGLAVSYASSDTNIAKIIGNRIQIRKTGSCTIYANQSGNALYNPAPQVSRTLLVNKAILSVTADNKSKTYGDINPSFTISYTGFKGTDNSSVLDTLSTAGTSATQYSNKGNYSIVPSGGGDNNYSFSFVNGNLVINKATLLVTADNKVKTYGDVNPAFTFSYTGFRGTDNSSVLDTLPTAGTSATQYSNKGNYTIIPSGGGDNNYSFSFVNGNLTINKATLLVTADNKVKTYGDVNPAFTFSYTGFRGTDNSSVLDTVPTASTSATQYSNTGNYTIVPSGGGDNNYSFSFVNGNLTINKATLLVTADNKVKTYGDVNPAFTLSYTGFRGTDNSSVLDTVPTASTSATQYSNTGNYTIVPSGGGDNNYSFSFVNGNLTINKATLLVTADNKAKTYGDVNPAFTISYTGFRGTDNSSVLDTLPTAGTSATQYSNTGNYSIIPSGGGDNNYSFSFVNGNLTINKATLLVTADNKVKTYGDVNPAFSLSYTGFRGTDNSSVLDTLPTAGTSATQYSNTGNYSIIPTGGDDNNYSFSFVNGNLTINKATLLVTADNKVKTYGDVNPAFSLSYTGFRGTDNSSVLDTLPTAGTSATQYSNKGNYTIIPSGGGDNNYSFSFVNGNLTINKATLLVTADNKVKTYGDVNPAFTFSYTGFRGTDNSSVLDTVPTASTSATQYSNTGNYSIIPSGGGDNNYSFSFVNGNLTINKATLLVTADNKVKTYGDVNPVFTFSYTGFRGTDNSSVLDTVPTASTAATQYSNTGNYTIVPSGGGDNNYSFSFVNGNLTINKATLLVTADNIVKTYGDVNPPLTITYGVFVGTDNISDIDTIPVVTTTVTQYSNVGVYSVQPFGGADNNYSFSYINGSFTIIKAKLTVTADNQNKFYGDTNPLLTMSFAGFAGTDLFTCLDTLPILSTSADEFSMTGNYPVIVSGGFDNNYTFTFVNGLLTIQKAKLNVTASDTFRNYNSGNPVFRLLYTGFKNLDDKNVLDTMPVATTTASLVSKAGKYPVFAGGGSDTNYSFQYFPGTLEIYPVLAIMKTISVINISQKTAEVNGEVLSDGGDTIFTRGFCWSSHHNPDITDSAFFGSATTGIYSRVIQNLTPADSYFVRAFGQNSKGIAYGDELKFKTLVSSVYEKIDPGILVFPNPARDYIHVVFDKVPDKNLLISLTDMSGKSIIQIIPESNHSLIDLSRLAKGIYFLDITTFNSHQKIKILKL